MFFCDEILSFLYLVLLSRKHKPSKDKNFRVNLHNYESWSVEVLFYHIRIILRLLPDSPRCREGFSSRRIGAIHHETVDVKCEVTADPRDGVKFSWTYNKSRDVLPVPGSRVINSGHISFLRYTPESDVDYGTLACWASNSIGQQKVPCLFHIVVASKYRPSLSCVWLFIARLLARGEC